MIPKKKDATGGGNGTGEERRKVRRIAVLKRAGLLDADPRLTVTRAMDLSDLLAAYTLVHDVYVEKGYLRPQESGLRIRLFEASPHMVTFLAKVDGSPVGVLSAVPDTPEMGLPSDVGFNEELQQLRRQGRFLCEITNLAVKPECHRSGAFFKLMQAGVGQSIRFGCDDMFSAISPCHAAFFGDVVQLEPWGGRRSYSQDFEDIVVGMRMNLRTVGQQFLDTDKLLGENAFLHDYFIAKNPLLKTAALWAFAAERYFSDPAMLQELLIRRGGLLEFCGPRDLEALRHQWGHEVFEKVMMTAEVQEVRAQKAEQLSAAQV